MRTLQIELAGDYFTGRTLPKIRISGHWLAVAGFQPLARVRVELPKKGVIVLRAYWPMGKGGA